MSELEVRINKRWVERGVFLLIIAVLVFLYLTKGGESSSESSKINELQQQITEKNNQIATLEQEKTALKTEMENSSEVVPVVPKAPALAKPALSGVLSFDWDIDTIILTPAMDHAEEIAEKQLKVDELQDKYDGASDSSVRADLRDQIQVLENEIDDLKVGDDKLFLNAVTLTADNGKETAAVVEYAFCWLSIECSKIKSTGPLTIAGGKKETFNLSITIPSTLSLDKQQIFQMQVKQDGKEIFREQETFSQH